MAQPIHTIAECDGQPIPFMVYKEWRQSVRYALGKKAVLVRVPKFYTKSMIGDEIKKAVEWMEELKKKKPKILRQYTNKVYNSGDAIQITNKSYTLEITDITSEARVYSRAKLNRGTIYINIAESDPTLRGRTIQTLLSRVISQDNLPRIKRRVHELNELYFKKPITNVKLKYNKSNWGSCSTKGNINLSSRLLFAPMDVQDYVIIHELAHLIEHNHSSRFWKLVKDAMPDYKSKEQWLKANSALCDF